jgi:hypothetical protein
MYTLVQEKEIEFFLIVCMPCHLLTTRRESIRQGIPKLKTLADSNHLHLCLFEFQELRQNPRRGHLPSQRENRFHFLHLECKQLL